MCRIRVDAHGEESVEVAVTHLSLAQCHVGLGALGAAQLAAEEALRLSLDKSDKDTRRAREILRSIRKVGQ